MPRPSYERDSLFSGRMYQGESSVRMALVNSALRGLQKGWSFFEARTSDLV